MPSATVDAAPRRRPLDQPRSCARLPMLVPAVDAQQADRRGPRRDRRSDREQPAADGGAGGDGAGHLPGVVRPLPLPRPRGRPPRRLRPRPDPRGLGRSQPRRRRSTSVRHAASTSADVLDAWIRSPGASSDSTTSVAGLVDSVRAERSTSGQRRRRRARRLILVGMRSAELRVGRSATRSRRVCADQTAHRRSGRRSMRSTAVPATSGSIGRMPMTRAVASTAQRSTSSARSDMSSRSPLLVPTSDARAELRRAVAPVVELQISALDEQTSRSLRSATCCCRSW